MSTEYNTEIYFIYAYIMCILSQKVMLKLQAYTKTHSVFNVNSATAPGLQGLDKCNHSDM